METLTVSLVARAFLTLMGMCVLSTAYAGPGEHIRVGDTTISPSIGLVSDFDTNATQTSSEASAALSFLVRPTLELATEGSGVSFNLLGQQDTRKYASSALSYLDRVRDFKVIGDLDAMKNSTFGLQIAQGVQMLSDPNDSAPETWEGVFDEAQGYNTRFVNRTGVAGIFRLGPTLMIKAGGDFDYDDYRSPVGFRGSLESTNRRSGYGPSGEIAWTFFPRTAVVAVGEYTMYRWGSNVLDASGDSGGLGEYVVIPNSSHLKAQTGLRGRLTERLVVVAMAGYGNGVYDEESISASGAEGDAAAVGFDADTKGVERLLVSGQARYRLGTSQNISASYLKNFTDVFFTNYASFHDIGLGWNGEFGERFTISATARVRLENYKGEVTRQDQLIHAGLSSAFKIADWSSLALSTAYLGRISTADSANYSDLNTQLSFGVTY